LPLPPPEQAAYATRRIIELYPAPAIDLRDKGAQLPLSAGTACISTRQPADGTIAREIIKALLSTAMDLRDKAA